MQTVIILGLIHFTGCLLDCYGTLGLCWVFGNLQFFVKFSQVMVSANKGYCGRFFI